MAARGTAALVVGLVLGVPAAAQADSRGFSFGVAAGEVTPTSARLWARADRPGRVRLRVTSCRRGRGIVRRLRARRSRDLTVQAVVRRLKPARRYCYRFRMSRGRRSELGSFRTAPPRTADRPVRFAISGDADAQSAPGRTTPFYNRFEVYERMRARINDFNINMGDVIYSDTEVPGVRTDAITLQQKWAKYRLNFALPNLQRMRSTGATYSHWDDHEFYNDFAKDEGELQTGIGDDSRRYRGDLHKLYRDGVAAFRDYNPVNYSQRNGIYRTFRWGKHLELFFLDLRSFRSPTASAFHRCDNPNTGEPDFAPTAEGTVARTAFSLVVPAVRGPVSQRCKDTINDPRRTHLGQRQYERLTREIKASTATFKVIVNEVPIQQYYIDPYDTWEGYAAERLRLIRFLRDNVKNVIFLTTDVHSNFVNDVRLKTLEPGGPENSGILEVTTGPVATMTFEDEIDRSVTTGTGDAIFFSVLKPPPPQGVGMMCGALDEFSYAQVEVTATRLTVILRDQDDGPVTEEPGLPPCGPYTITKR